MLKHKAFTMIELIFVIVIMGIIGKFGMEFLVQAYRSFIFTSVNNNLQSTSGIAVELIAAKLQHRIKDSVIARVTVPPSAPGAIGSADGNYTVLEWVGVDYEGFRGSCDLNATPYAPNWSGIIDLDNTNANANVLVSPETNTTQVNSLISILSDGNATLSDSALFFIGSNSNVVTDYGWNGDLTSINAQTGAMHPIKSIAGQENQFAPDVSSFSGVDVYEYYQLAWTAYAIVYEAGANNLGTLRLYWNYQPWEDRDADGNADQFNSAPAVKSAIIMENVSTFQFMAIGDIIKIQVCTKSTIIDGINDQQGYSLCKEKTVF
jgi:prepilin-type N-terminal cleavage/methylation domain-containing protein